MNIEMEVKQGYNRIKYSFKGWTRFAEFLQETLLSADDVEVTVWIKDEEIPVQEAVPDSDFCD